MVFGDWLLGWGAGTMVDFGMRWLQVVSVCSTMCILSMVARNHRHSVFTSTTCSCKHIFLLIAEVSPFPSKSWGWLPFRRWLLIWRQSYYRIALAIEACCMVASWSTKEWRMFVVVAMPRPTQCKTEHCKQWIEEESIKKFEMMKKRNYKTKKVKRQAFKHMMVGTCLQRKAVAVVKCFVWKPKRQNHPKNSVEDYPLALCMLYTNPDW